MTTSAREASTYGGAPLALVVFDPGNGTVYHYTNADASFVYLGNTYTPTAMVVGEQEMTDEDGAGAVEIRLARTDPVAALFVGGLAPQPVAVTVFRTHRDVSDALTTFFGEVGSAHDVGAETVLACVSERQALRRTLPRVTVQKVCPWMLGDADCGINLASYRTSFGVTAVTNNPDGTQTLGFDIGALILADGYYAAGVADLDGYESYIVAQAPQVAGVFTVTLLTPLPGVAFGSAVNLTAGCDRTTGSNGCTKFANIARFGGFPGLASRNPFDGLR